MSIEVQTGSGRSPARRRGAVRRGGKRREREIVDAAAKIFHEQGYANTSVQDIADAVGILKGSLYYYIDSKQDLLFRVLSEVLDDALVIIEELQAMDVPPLLKLREYVRRHVEYNASNLTKISVYYHDFAMLSQERRATILGLRRSYEAFLCALIEEAQRRGEVDREHVPNLLANSIFGTVNWIYTWYRPDGRASPQEIGDLYGELVINGVRGARMPQARRASEARAGRRSHRPARAPAPPSTP